MSITDTYYEKISHQLRQIKETQMDAIDRAADMFCRCVLNERWIYVFGTGHSHMMAEELFYRAGGLTRIRPILHPPLMLHLSAHDSTTAERDISIAPELLRKYPISSGDVLLVASNSGRNAVPVELALRASDHGAQIIALVNRRHSAEYSSRHPSTKKLPDVADLIIDNCGVVGDACVPMEDPAVMVGAASTVTGAAILQMITCATVEKLIAHGVRPEVFVSSNTEREEDNERLVSKLKEDVRHL